jgi:hypothetical protein
MANSKISALISATTPLAGTEVLPIVQSSTTKKVSVADLTAGRSISAASATISGDLTVDTSTLKVDSTNNRVGMGTATPRTTADVRGQLGVGADLGYAGSGSIYIYEGSNPSIRFYDNTNNSGITGGGANGILIDFYGANRVQITDNIIPLAAGKGINFTANTPASGMTSQLLNWYEEGTFTPTWNGGTVTINSSYYTRVGRLVNWILDITFGTSATVANSQLTLPFTATGSWGGGSINYTDYGTTATINIDAAANGLFFRSAVNGGNLNCPLVATKRFICVITYFA